MSASAAARGCRARRIAFVALLFALPLTLRALPVEHGLPRGYVPDTHVVRSALAMAQARSPLLPPGEYSAYPNLMPYMLLPLYAAQYGWGRMRGEWADAREFADRVSIEPGRVHLVARWLVVILGALTPWAAWRLARAAGARRGAWIAALLVATSVLHTQFSTHERPWVPMTLFVVLAAWAAVVHVRGGAARALVLCGGAAGLAFATHQSGVFVLGLPALAWAFRAGGWRGGELGSRLLDGLLALAAFALASIPLGYAHLVLHGGTDPQAVIGGSAADVSIGGLSAVLRLRWATFERLSRVLLGYEPILLLLGLPGLVLALRRRCTAPIAVWTLLWSGLFLTYWTDQVRYLLPTAALLSLPAALLAERCLERPRGAVLLAALLALALVQDLRLATLLGRPDTRAEAEQRLAQLPAGALVAIDRYGPDVELSADALRVLADMRARRGQSLRLREQRRAELLAAGGAELAPGVDALPLGDLLAFDERARTLNPWPELVELGADPSSLLDALGVTHLLVAERRPGEAGRGLLAALIAGREPEWVIDPSRARGGGEERPAEAWLPTEMDFPLTGLWQVARPGPRLELYDLSSGR